VGGKVVFSTEMVAYQSVLTDTKYDGKMVVMTFPLIGNYGINSEDIGTKKVAPKAMIVREKCDFPSNFRMEMTLEDFFKQHGIVGLSEVDTRAIAKQLRDTKEMNAVIMLGEPTEEEVKAFFEEVE
jgi:carbamoyl-phosphate synthase small subunit